MPGLSESLAEIDRLIHEPARLALLTALSAIQQADFLFLQRLIGLTAGNLSAHLARLEESGLIWQKKTIRGKRPHTEIGLTPAGRAAIERHWRQLEDLRRQASVAPD
jgi:DNA-binding MarR family transcriptional regulator